MRFSSALFLASILAVTSSHGVHNSINDDRSATYLSNPSVPSRLDRRAASSDPVQIALAHFKTVSPSATLRSNGDSYTSDDSGITHVYLTQTHNGLDIINAQGNVNIKNGKVVSSGNSLVNGKINAPAPVRRATIIDPLEALKGAIQKMGYDLDVTQARAVQDGFSTMRTAGGAKNYRIEGAKGAVEDPKAELVYYQTATGEVKLAWKLTTDLDESYMLTYANANVAGDILGAANLVSEAQYNVYPLGVNDPSDGKRVLLTDPANESASPRGWHDDGTTKYTDTRGNNGRAQENWDGTPDWENNHCAEGGEKQVFNFPYDPKAHITNTTEARGYIDAALSQLFYTSNIYHDFLEVLGFTEAAGNFEELNSGSLGMGGDAVQLNAQDGSGMNNANFMTPPDGQRPRMRMYLWNSTEIITDGDFDNGIILHDNRLTGGPARTDCLYTIEAGGMGEGWSDFFPTALRIKPGDNRKTNYAMGDWANGVGIRPHPYSTDMKVNPTTYSWIGPNSTYWKVHPVGHVWATMLYDLMWNLEDKFGYSPNPFPTFRKNTRIPKHGRHLAMKLVLEGMKLQPCFPTFLTARDAIVDADYQLTGGENACEIWSAFAKRGLGVDARTEGNDKIDGFKMPEKLKCHNKNYEVETQH
ncbi:Similar to Extracellular metalloproteinase mep; acc. no. P46075 [Pyronema omphalodes CBS 100304]|uniref:Extracellular metalloproteinase n=1 Tax=Pyronema omphalodes (strain CBS 100304) TaxID=1076935 RepID=U4LKM1_PYROM|nr:Similar to Extracellular metalloproteinase mep; acc. no. P46075 [Pyronema omphalodes CBS 100304]